MIHYECTACKARLKASPERAGRRNRCPRCGAVTAVPALPRRTTTMKAANAHGSLPQSVKTAGPTRKHETSPPARSLGGLLVYALGFAVGLYTMLQMTGVFDMKPVPGGRGAEKSTPLAGTARNGNATRREYPAVKLPADAQVKALEEVKTLLKKGGAVNGDYGKGLTPLHWAARHGFTQVAEFLIENGADLNAKERAIAQSTPLHVAATYNQVVVARLLIAKGGRVDATDKWGSTPLQYAAFNGHDDLIELLLYKGANINHQETRYGITALHAAVAGGKLSTAKLLIGKGVNLTIRNHAGETALGTAMRTRQQALVKLLQEHSQQK